MPPPSLVQVATTILRDSATAAWGRVRGRAGLARPPSGAQDPLRSRSPRLRMLERFRREAARRRPAPTEHRAVFEVGRDRHLLRHAVHPGHGTSSTISAAQRSCQRTREVSSAPPTFPLAPVPSLRPSGRFCRCYDKACGAAITGAKPTIQVHEPRPLPSSRLRSPIWSDASGRD